MSKKKVLGTAIILTLGIQLLLLASSFPVIINEP